ncbi:MAG: TIGR00645 family protein [Paracoccaceae bacterium]
MSDTEQPASRKPTIESRFEQTLFSSRWLMAPMYFGLVVSLAMLVVIFVKELVVYVPAVLTMTADQGILAILTLIDMTLAGNLLLIVMFSGYENFVSKLDIDHGADRPDWMGKVDFSGLKMKLIASIVAISGIHLLKVFMSLGKNDDPAHAVSLDTLRWMVIIHLTFVTSGVLLALMDWLTAKTDKH